MTQWEKGQLLRMTHRRFLFMDFSTGLPVALGLHNLDQGQFKVVHQFGDQPPQVGEQMLLVQGRQPDVQRSVIWITGITHDPNDADQLIYSFRS